jgi:hypothetical protein
MGGTWQPVFDRVPKSRNMRIDRETLFVTSDIESCDAASLETFDEPSSLESLRGAEMPQGAQDQTGFDPSGTNACFGCAVDRRHDGFRPHPVLDMKQGRESDLRVDYTVAGELFKKIPNHESQSLFALHELKTSWRTSEEIGQAGALRRGDELAFILSTRNGRIEPGDNGIAERTI